MYNEFILLTIAHVIAVASPGADFAVVLNNTLKNGRQSGVMTAIGVGCGISVHLIYTLLGIAILFKQIPMLFDAVRFVGAAYLLWIAWQAFQSRASRVKLNTKSATENMTLTKAFRQGFLTNVFNPKVTVFFLVLFTGIVSITTPIWVQSLYGLWLTIYTMLWFIFVARTFSSAPGLTLVRKSWPLY